jgi:hypothetical protein
VLNAEVLTAAAEQVPGRERVYGLLILLAQKLYLQCSKTSVNLLTGEVDFSRALTYPSAYSKNNYLWMVNALSPHLFPGSGAPLHWVCVSSQSNQFGLRFLPFNY